MSLTTRRRVIGARREFLEELKHKQTRPRKKRIKMFHTMHVNMLYIKMACIYIYMIQWCNFWYLLIYYLGIMWADIYIYIYVCKFQCMYITFIFNFLEIWVVIQMKICMKDSEPLSEIIPKFTIISTKLYISTCFFHI